MTIMHIECNDDKMRENRYHFEISKQRMRIYVTWNNCNNSNMLTIDNRRVVNQSF